MKLLHIDASPRTVRSITRRLSSGFVKSLRLKNGELRVVHRDVGHHPPPFISDAWAGAAFSQAERNDPAMKGILHHSDELAQEVLNCDALVIASPMHNFTISASLKAWIDHIVRADLTFKITEQGPVPLVHGKKALVVTSRGGYVAGTAYDFQEPYLRTILGFIGITDVTFVHTEGVNSSDEEREKAITTASAQLLEIAKKW